MSNAPAHKSHTKSVAIIAAVVAAGPVWLPAAAGFYSAVQQCDKDATDLETQLTSTLLEIEDREARMLHVLTTSPTTQDALNHELVQIETGADGHYSDPAFKDHALSGLINQYNRLLRRIDFPSDSACGSDTACRDARKGLQPDADTTHAALVSLDLTKAEAHQHLGEIQADMAQVQQQLAWREHLGPIHRCSPFRMVASIVSDQTEPWKLIRLVPRPN